MDSVLCSSISEKFRNSANSTDNVSLMLSLARFCPTYMESVRAGVLRTWAAQSECHAKRFLIKYVLYSNVIKGVRLGAQGVRGGGVWGGGGIGRGALLSPLPQCFLLRCLYILYRFGHFQLCPHSPLFRTPFFP